MADLKEAFSSISSIPWSAVPLDNLESFLHECFTNAEVLLNSVPVNAPATSSGDENNFSSHEAGWRASKAIDTLATPHQTAIDERTTELQKQWGKPIKLAAKDNPLGVSVYKTAAFDRHGAWFGRRSVHTGLGFNQWKHAMRREFIESVKVKTGPGAGAVRGIAGEQRLEKKRVPNVGIVEVWQLSAAFPGPVTPRQFTALLLTSDNALSEASSFNSEPSTENIPRHFVLISRPTTHEGAVPKRELVQGTYESVEMIREIPGVSEDPESNPVEWVMITRSDPGGGIPKFMVERGTPGSIAADVPKFIDWAINIGELPQWDEEAEDAAIEKEIQQASQAEESSDAANDSLTPMETASSSPVTRQISQQPSQGTAPATTHGNYSLLGNLTSAIGSTISPYVPNFGSNTAAKYPTDEEDEDEDDDSSYTSDTASEGTIGTYASAPEPHSATDGVRPLSPLSLNSAQVRETAAKPLNSHEKELQKLNKRRVELDDRLTKAREQDEKKTQEAIEKDEHETAKAAERRERELKKAEDKYRKEMEKLEERRLREERKAEQARVKEERRLEERRKKAREKDSLLKAQRERDEARERLEVMASENEVMRAQVEELQRENNVLVQKLGTFGESGAEAIRKIKEDAEVRSRASSKSHASSLKSKEGKEQAE